MIDTGDTAWILMSTALVMLMLPGLALFYGGLVRANNVLSTIMHSFFGLAIVTVVWVVVGYSLAFADGNAIIGGLGKLGLSGITPETLSGTIPEYVFVMFQGMFAIITPALIVGAFAERVLVPARIAAVISNRADAYGLERARRAGIPTQVLSHKGYPDRESYDAALAERIDRGFVDLDEQYPPVSACELRQQRQPLQR
mgnify:CR=1 FL=1